MNILEKDLFNYIFHQDILSEEKLRLISIQKELYSNEFELLRNIKKQLKEKLSNEIYAKIVTKIKNFEINPKNLIFLEKRENPFPSKSDHLVLSADSPILEQKLRTDTYQDKDSKYLVKIVNDKSQNKIFIFSNDNRELKDIKLNLQPSGRIINIESSKIPYIISPKEKISNISFIAE